MQLARSQSGHSILCSSLASRSSSGQDSNRTDTSSLCGVSAPSKHSSLCWPCALSFHGPDLLCRPCWTGHLWTHGGALGETFVKASFVVVELFPVGISLSLLPPAAHRSAVRLSINASRVLTLQSRTWCPSGTDFFWLFSSWHQEWIFANLSSQEHLASFSQADKYILVPRLPCCYISNTPNFL